MRAGRHLRAARGGTTLLEILVALTVTALVAGIALAVYFTVTSSIRREDRAQQLGGPAAEVLASLRSELARCVAPQGQTNGVFTLARGSTGLTDGPEVALRFHTVTLAPGQDDWRGLELQALEYTWRADESGTSGTLAREETAAGTAAFGESGRSRREVLRGAADFAVWVWDGYGWTNAWESTAQHVLPLAARIRLEWRQGSADAAREAWTLIPAGRVFPKPTGASPGAPAPGRPRSVPMRSGSPPVDAPVPQASGAAVRPPAGG